MMVPWQVNIVPAFVLIKKVGLVEHVSRTDHSDHGRSVRHFLMRQFIREIPNDLLDSARIDGCKEFYIYWRIVLPLCRPALASLSIFMFMQQWNNFVWPLIIIHDSKCGPCLLVSRCSQRPVRRQFRPPHGRRRHFHSPHDDYVPPLPKTNHQRHRPRRH
jgi:ABC-type glycerol-3-phosphate transport system permease component